MVGNDFAGPAVAARTGIYASAVTSSAAAPDPLLDEDTPRRGRRHGWRPLAIAAGVILLIGVIAVVGLWRVPSTQSSYRLSDGAGRVSIEVPVSWRDITGTDAGGVFSDGTGDWLVPDIQAGGEGPRVAAVWIDRPWNVERALAEQHAGFVADSCINQTCQSEEITEHTVDGFRALRQVVHHTSEGYAAVALTVHSDRAMVFVSAAGEDHAAGIQELTAITDTLRFMR